MDLYKESPIEESPELSVQNFNIKDSELPKVFICNQSGHDFSPAERYGSLEYVTKGMINRFSVNYMARAWASALQRSKPNDYILITSLTILTCIGCAIFGHLHSSINLLIYRNGKYISRRICFKSLFASLDVDAKSE